MATTLWLFYMALEPYVRRLRPQTLISWTRLLSGDASHPIVGRDLLIGATWGAACASSWLSPSGFPPRWARLSARSTSTSRSSNRSSVAATSSASCSGGRSTPWPSDSGRFSLSRGLRLLLKHDLAAAVALVAVLTVFEAATPARRSPWLRLGLTSS